jgi:hypothetical protein
MATNLVISINVGDVDQPYGESGTEWVDVSASDSLIFTDGSDTVKDGEPIPSSFQIACANPFLNPDDPQDIVIEKYLLADISDNELKESFLMGQQDTRYVLAFNFDGITTSEPVLEVWDNSNFNTVNLTCLGSGTPSLSWIHGITTTDGSAGADWSGYTLAGSSNGHFLWLNNQNGALSVATTLYANIYLEIPASQVAGGQEMPVICIKYTTV